MGKVVTLYLSDDAARDLKEFCDENQCTQYSALKTAVRQILSKPMQEGEVDIPEKILNDRARSLFSSSNHFSSPISFCLRSCSCTRSLLVRINVVLG